MQTHGELETQTGREKTKRNVEEWMKICKPEAWSQMTPPPKNSW